MELLPIALGQTQSVESASVDAQPVSNEFSELLTGQEAIDTRGAPPGVAPPPGIQMPVEEAEIPEPNALSQTPDFHPQVETQVFFMPGVNDESSVEKVDDSKTKTSDTAASAITTAIAGALALQPVICPKPVSDPTPIESEPLSNQNNELSIQNVAYPPTITIENQEPTKIVAPAMPNLSVTQPQITPQLEVQTAGDNVKLEVTPNTQNIGSEVSRIDSKSTPLTEVDKTAKAWQTTEQRAMNDLAFLGKYDDVAQFSASRGDVKSVTNASLMTTAFVEPTDSDPIPVATVNNSTTPTPTPKATPESTQTKTPTSEVNLTSTQSMKVDTKATQTPIPTNAPVANNPGLAVDQASAQNIASELSSSINQQEMQNTKSAAKTNSDSQDAQSIKDQKTATAQATEAASQSKKSANSGQSQDNPASQGNSKSPIADTSLKAKSSTSEDAKSVDSISSSGVKATLVTESSQVNRTDTVSKAQPQKALTTSETRDVIRQIVDRAEMAAASKPKDGVTIKLEPRDLGSITLVVKSIGDQIDAQIVASDQRVKQALESSQTQLAQAMDRRGFNLNSISISDQSSSANYTQLQEQARQFGQQPQTRHDQNMQTPQQFGTTNSRNDQAVGLEETRNSIRKASGRSLDLWT